MPLRDWMLVAGDAPVAVTAAWGMTIALGIVGIGKIARDQHLPTIAASPDFTLVAAASRNAVVGGVANYPDLDAMLAADAPIIAVALCQPPQSRYPAAREAILAGKHVFLEKPPGATLSEVAQLADLAARRGVTLFASWHSRYAAGVEPARAWLAGKAITHATIAWREDIRVWHPGQDWILAAGGMGVFDPGINALSIATHILPPFHLTGGTLDFPANRQAPIFAELAFAMEGGGTMNAVFDFLQTGPQTWDITVDTDMGQLRLSAGGARLFIDGVEQALPDNAEYGGLYDRFAALIAQGESDVDDRPLRHVADAFMLGKRRTVTAFDY